MSNTELSKKDEQALRYHESGRPGKIEVRATKSTVTANDLSLAYSPGVAVPCMEIYKNPEDVFKYTSKGNLVGVVSNGSAVLGLGNIGALAGKPVMEGKGVLFKKFADIDVFDIEVDEPTVEGMVRVVKSLEPTFGGINLEDIKAPECFEIEQQLKELMDIPVFHDDQHGTAIIATAALINALELTGKKMADVKAVFSGAGAASIAIANLMISLGMKKENLFMCDSKGVIYKGRPLGMNKYKEQFANDTEHRTIADVMDGADVFLGCSAKGVIDKKMVKTMAAKPIIFAMANPNPEIMPEEVAEVRDDAIMATGRSDYPNQVNNVLGFPFIFRGALDVRARKINEEMKLAAVYALANLAKEEVPEDVKLAYGNIDFKFGPDYLIPKPFDKRVLTRVAPAVAKAAMDSGVAKFQIDDMQAYILELAARLDIGGTFTRTIRNKFKDGETTKVVFPAGGNSRVLRAVSQVKEEGLVTPVLMGDPSNIRSRMKELDINNLDDIEIIHPTKHEKYDDFVKIYHNERQRKGITYNTARDHMKISNYYGSMLVKEGIADGMVTGATQNYSDCFKPIMRVLNKDSQTLSAGIMILIFKGKILFLADCTANINPNAEQLSQIAKAAHDLYVKLMNRDPRIAFLSYSNFGASRSESPSKMAKATELTKELLPHISLDGEMQADVAVNPTIMNNLFSFNTLNEAADILIFPSLDAANISYKLLSQLAEVKTFGPVLVPFNNAINIVQRTSSVEEIVNMTYLTAALSKDIVKEE